MDAMQNQIKERFQDLNPEKKNLAKQNMKKSKFVDDSDEEHDSSDEASENSDFD
jgi:hypothetical protein